MTKNTTLAAFIIAISVFSVFAHAKVLASFDYYYGSPDLNSLRLFDSPLLPQDCSVESFRSPGSFSAPYRFGPHDRLIAESVCVLPVPEAEQFRDVASRDIVWR